MITNAEGLTRDRILQHWGSNAPSLCQLAFNRFKAIGAILLLKHCTPWNENYKATLFLVSYTGQGKYSNRRVAIPWHILPKSEEENPDAWQLALPEEASGESSWRPTTHAWLPGDHDRENEYHWLRTASGKVLVVACALQWL